MRPPADVDAREPEWAELASFAAGGRPHATLGLVSGRRRMGKSTLLRALCRETGGFYFAVPRCSYQAFLAEVTAAIGRFTASPPPTVTSLPQAFEALLDLGRGREIPVVVDGLDQVEAPLAELTGAVTAAFAGDAPGASRARLILAGPAVSSEQRPLLRDRAFRDLAVLDLRLEGHDYRRMASWWGIGDPAVALPLHAIVGGTPVHRDWVAEPPSGPGDFGPFTRRTVLHVGHPLFDAARRTLRDEPGPSDIGYYRAIPFHVAFGVTRLDLIAARMQHPPEKLRRHLAVLTATGLLERSPDLLEAGRIHYRVGEPLFNFFVGMMRVDMGRIQRGYILEYLWKYRADRWSDFVLKPHFAHVCRTWAKRYAPSDLFEGRPARVGTGTLRDPDRTSLQTVDLVALDESDPERPELAALGLTAWDRPMEMSDLARMQRFRDLLAAAGHRGTDRTRLLCFGGTGFSPELEKAASRGEVRLVEAAELYS
ncbi:hypothetical protein AB0I28_33800 [Phytomonospora sp. NPDC050363]|uniref:AAA family ATPase n=1 Tax=Phytomonospora sp. NPDC050363 TaxID=3155642 RepID=UPI00341171D1